MAKRPLFVPNTSGTPGVEEKIIDFKWHAGFSKPQKQKSIYELHSEAYELGYNKVLEISSKSVEDIGVNLSAFNLLITTKKYSNTFTVETAFQGSKVFTKGGPYRDLFGLDSLAAKKDVRLKESGDLIRFDFFGKSFPLVPKTYFYDWLYINALVQNNDLADAVIGYDAFTDIEFNPEKSMNCQAHSVAMYVSLIKNCALEEALKSPEDFLHILKPYYNIGDCKLDIQNSMTF